MKPTSMEKALRGLSLKEFEALIRLCCTEGKRLGLIGGEWNHSIMGVPLKFFHGLGGGERRGLYADFRLSGDGWAISFKGTKLAAPYSTQYCDMWIGPLHRDPARAPSEAYYVYDFRRRGNLDHFRRNLSLLRLML